MRLGIDLDGVVADFNTGWMQRYNEEFAASLRPEDITTWDAMTDLADFATVEDFWEWARNDGGPGLFRHLPVYPGALESLERLSTNHAIVIITTKPTWATSETFAWIADHQRPTNEVHITGDKWVVECDVYLDDGPHNLTALVRERPDRTVCRFVRPWNHPVVGTVDVGDWDTFETLVDQKYC